MATDADALATITRLMATLEGMQEGYNLLTKIVADHEREINDLKMKLARAVAIGAQPARSSILRAH